MRCVTRGVHQCRDPVYDMAWLQSKSGSEAMTVSSDGRALWWDTRRLGEPTEELKLAERGSEAACGAVCLDYSPAAGPTKCAVQFSFWAFLTTRSAVQPQHRSSAWAACMHAVCGLPQMQPGRQPGSILSMSRSVTWSLLGTGCMGGLTTEGLPGPGSWWAQSRAACCCATARPRRPPTASWLPTQVPFMPPWAALPQSGSHAHHEALMQDRG